MALEIKLNPNESSFSCYTLRPVYTGHQKLLEGPELETLTLKQQMAPHNMPKNDACLHFIDTY